MKNEKEEQYKKELRQAFQKTAKDDRFFHLFLEDILTPAEYREIANRLQIVKLLKKGLPHRKIVEMLGVGAATVERGARVIANKSGGINKVFGM